MKKNPNFKNKTRYVLLILFVLVSLSSCSVFKYNSKGDEKETDIVCSMKVNKSEAYISEYKGKKYYFDSSNCKKTFDMNPEKYINNTCTPVK
jgi:YHS domain-containing protein